MLIRNDLVHIFERIPPKSRVLDLGCGDGELLRALKNKKDCFTYGVDIDNANVIKGIEKDVCVIKADLERGLSLFEDDSFDFIILSQTIQAMRNTEIILRDIMRVSKDAFVTFPNFRYWKNLLQLNFTGRMPMSESMDYNWYDTPNIHWCTLKDFDALCDMIGIQIREKTVMTNHKRINVMQNLLGSLALYWIQKKD